MDNSNNSSRFQKSSSWTNEIPLKEVGYLVGRSKDRAFLSEKIDSIHPPSAPSQVVVVEGDSGTGKTSLIQSLRSEEGNTLFVSGKYYQESSLSYGGLLDAFSDLCVALPESERDSVSRQLQRQLEPQEIEILAKLMPFAKEYLQKHERNIGSEEKKEQHEDYSTTSVDMRTEHSLHRVTVILLTFLLAFASTEHPVVLVLDDIQYADEASRRFVTLLVSSFEGSNTLIILSSSSRGEEGDGSDRFQLEDFKSGLEISTLTLGPLDRDSVNEIVSTAIERRPQETWELTDVVIRKTGRNPHFCVQYLELLHREGLIGFSFMSNKWEWADVDHIVTQTNVSENVGQIMTSKIESMPATVQVVLMLAASLRAHNLFSQDLLLSIVSEDPILEALRLDPRWAEAADAFSVDTEDQPEESALNKALSLAIQVGLLESSNATTSTSTPDHATQKLKFSHGLVQQASGELFSKGTTGELLNQHLGELLLQQASTTEGDTLLYASVSLLLHSSESHKKKNYVELAQLCLEAAEQASRTSAFITSANYADSGLELLNNKNKWEDHYELTLALSTISAQMHFAYGNLNKTQVPLLEILENARNMNDMSAAYSVKVAACGARCDFAGGIRDGGQAVRALGVRIPENPRMFHVALAAMKATRAMKKRSLADLRKLPLMTDPAVKEAMHVLKLLTCYDWRSGRANHLMLHGLAMVQLTLTYGLSAYSPYAFSMYGVLKAVEGKFDEAYNYGALAMELAERPELREGYTWTVKVVHLFLHHLRHPIFDSLGPYLKCFEMGKAIGDITVACYSLQAHAMIGIVAGMPLDDLIAQINGYIDFFIEYKQVSPMMEIQPYYQLALNLKGQCDDPLVLSGEAMDEKEFQSTALASKQGAAAMGMFIYAKTMLLYVFGALHLADRERQKITPQTDIPSSFFMKYLNIFFSALICFGLARDAQESNNRKRKRQYLKLARPYVKQLRTYASCGSVNSIPLLKLVEAEELALRGMEQAQDVFEDAISMAGRSGFHLVKGIAYERAGVHHMQDLRDESAAKYYLQLAKEEFLDYHAFGKAKQLSDKYEVIKDEMSERDHCSTFVSSSRRMKPFLVKSWEEKVDRV